MIRVLIVDDSVVVRRSLSDALASDPEISVVGCAANGSIALQKLTQLNPDVVLLDVEMPQMDGIETVRRLRKDWPRLPVIMCSALTERGANVTLRALAAGATDYVAKPTAAAGSLAGLAAFTNDLVAKVKALVKGRAVSQSAALGPVADLLSLADRQRLRPAVAALGIGCSTGGPNALAALFERIPADLPVPIFIVQHMPRLFTKILAERLSWTSGFTVIEAAHASKVESGHVYIAPGDHHMTVAVQRSGIVTLLNQDPAENSCRPAVDVLFRSLARVYGAGVLGCVLTGMGGDGARGARNIVDAGGVVVVQSAETCVVPSMPGAVVAAGLADRVLPLAQLAAELVWRVQRSRAGLARAPDNLAQRET
ncbi:MAG: chemotaxis response regulator protein-glutamate methylesterase [Pseudomonadota bacterium]